jgi:glycerol-3-phosphate dehydrogenase (NAD(P)+)
MLFSVAEPPVAGNSSQSVIIDGSFQINMQVGIIGRGSFGQAIGSLLEHNQVPFEYADVKRNLTGPTDVIFLMVPTQAIRSAIQANRAAITEETVIINGSKGIEENTHLLPQQIIADLGITVDYYSLLGPSFAYGIKAHHPTIVSLGYDDPWRLEQLTNMLQTDYFRVHPIKGCEMLELAGAFKNLYAILCGYAKGLGYGSNTRAALIMLAAQEFSALAKARGYADYDVVSPGVLGDMVLTCSSERSRNFQFGQLLAKGEDTPESAQTTEGYHTALSVVAIAKQAGISLPVAELTAALTHESKTGAEHFRRFLASA